MKMTLIVLFVPRWICRLHLLNLMSSDRRKIRKQHACRCASALTLARLPLPLRVTHTISGATLSSRVTQSMFPPVYNQPPCPILFSCEIVPTWQHGEHLISRH